MSDVARAVVPRIGYRRYIASKKWRQKRARTARAGRCLACERPGAVDVHHRTYSTLGLERGWELVALCRRCHLDVHARTRLPANAGRPLWHVTDDVIYAERAVPYVERWWRDGAAAPAGEDPDKTR